MVKYIYMNYIQCLIIFLWNSKEMNDMYNENDVIKLKVKEIINTKNAFDNINGDRVFDKIAEVTKDNSNTVVLDFDGIELVNTAFLNNAIGRLFNKEDYNIEKNRVLISNMDDTKKELLKETISNAVKKYEYKVG